MSAVTRELRVKSGEVSLAVRARGDDARPTVILVHGYPDNSRMWEPIAEQLARRYHVVTYDVRGAGDSDAPLHTSAYQLDKFAEDLRAVADAVSPDRAFHLVGHDWGSIHSWESTTSAAMQKRIASFTSISGPCLDHAGHWLRHRVSRVTPRGLIEFLQQALSSWYIYLFHLPWIAELLCRWSARRWPAIMRAVEGVTMYPNPTQDKDSVNGIKLYRANIFQRVFVPRERRATMPVQLIVPRRDKYVRPTIADEIPNWVSKLWRRDVDAGHWVTISDPGLIAALVTEFVDFVESGHEPDPLRKARVATKRSAII